MDKFRFIETGLDGMFVVETTRFGDERGYFTETYNQQAFENAGHHLTFVQDNQSKSKKGVLRGLHFQVKNPQGKLVRVLEGEVFDVGVDIRPESDTYGKWFGVVLSAENGKQLYVPEGFAHGFLVLSDTAVFAYKCTRFYDPIDEGGILWNDPTIGIEWPKIDAEILLSEKDKHQNLFASIE